MPKHDRALGALRKAQIKISDEHYSKKTGWDSTDNEGKYVALKYAIGVLIDDCVVVSKPKNGEPHPTAWCEDRKCKSYAKKLVYSKKSNGYICQESFRAGY